MTKRAVDGRQIERRAPAPAVNFSDQPAGEVVDTNPEDGTNHVDNPDSVFSTKDVMAILPKLIK